MTKNWFWNCNIHLNLALFTTNLLPRVQNQCGNLILVFKIEMLEKLSNSRLTWQHCGVENRRYWSGRALCKRDVTHKKWRRVTQKFSQVIKCLRLADLVYTIKLWSLTIYQLIWIWTKCQSSSKLLRSKIQVNVPPLVIMKFEFWYFDR